MQIRDLKKRALHSSHKGFIWDVFAISIMLFVLFIGLPIVTGIGQNVTQQTIKNNPQMTANEVITLQGYSNGWFNNSPDIMMVFLYFILVIFAFIAASYEGANPAVTLIIGLILIVIAELVSFALADVAHAYITQVNYLNIAPHYTLSTYIMDNLPFFNGILMVAYMVFVISKREVITGVSGGGGNIVST